MNFESVNRLSVESRKRQPRQGVAASEDETRLLILPQKFSSTLTEDPEIRMSESSDIWEHSRKIWTAHTEPCRQGRGEFIHRSCWNPATLSGIVRSIDGQGRERSEQSAALDGAAEDELMAAPAVVGARTVRGESATKIRGGESGDVLSDPQFICRGIKRVQGLAQFREQVCLACQLITVRIVATDGTEKNLTAHAKIGPRGNEPGNHVQLLGQRGRGENGLQGRKTGESGCQQLVRSDRAGNRIRISLLEQIVMRQRQEIPESLQTHVGVRAAVESGQANASIGRNIVRKDGVSDFEGVRSGDRDGKRDL
jgi:hypothetical protein